MNTLHHQQQGLTLIELMIALTLGLLTILAVTSLVIFSKSTQAMQQDAAHSQDAARYALDNISRAVKQAGYVNFDQEEAPFIHTENMTASVTGFDAHSLQAKKNGIDSPIPHSINSSDILALRFFGSGIPADNTVLNCAGIGVAAPTSQDSAEAERGWSIYYVADDVGGEPALFCKYVGKSNFSAESIARGVESFQVLYGINTSFTVNASTTQFLSATEIAALDSTIPKEELNQKTHWKKVTTIKVAMLIRGTENTRSNQSNAIYHLFGEDYSNSRSAHDQGTQIIESDLPIAQRKRLRKVVSATFQLRNAIH